MTERLRFLSAGEQGLVVEFGDKIDPAVNQKVHRLAHRLSGSHKAIREVIPTYRSLMVYFDPFEISRARLIEMIGREDSPEEEANTAQGEGRVIRVPVCYGGEYGPDLEDVAAHNSLAPEEVIRIHSSGRYPIFMLGFTPGFPYLGGMDEAIATPRLEKPRVRIPAGSVGIAGSQTGLYPIESPGGWRLIGRTPLTVFRPEEEQPFLFAAGDILEFYPVSPEEYLEIERQAAAGEYRPEITGGRKEVSA